jgi:hypothetical protein
MIDAALTMQSASMVPLKPRPPNALRSIDLGIKSGFAGQSDDSTVIFATRIRRLTDRGAGRCDQLKVS